LKNNEGVQTDHFKDDFTADDFPDATLPNVSVWFPPIGGTAPDGFIYDNLLTSGNYQVSDLTGSVYVGQPNTVLYVTGSISIGSGGGSTKKGDAPPQIHIAPGASLTIYMAGATAGIGGNGVVNDTGIAKNFAYLWSAQQHHDQYHREWRLFRDDLPHKPISISKAAARAPLRTSPVLRLLKQPR
jgi:hypothetical protein